MKNSLTGYFSIVLTIPFFFLLTGESVNAQITFSPISTLTVADQPRDVKVADLDLDGKPDLVVTNEMASGTSRSGRIDVLLGLGGGKFAPAAPYTTLPSPQSTAIGDFNSDGKPDIAVATLGYPVTTLTIGVFLNLGNGTFSPRSDIPFAGPQTSVQVADFNRDGKLDIASAIQPARQLGLVLGDGKGGFSQPIHRKMGTMPHELALGDINNDGKPDLLLTDVVDVTIDVLLGDGTGGFTAQQKLLPGSQPGRVALADMNKDGKVDALVLNTVAKTMAVFPGNGNGTFGAAKTTVLANGPSSLTIADFDRDGLDDVAITENDQNVGIQVFRNLGNFTFRQSSRVVYNHIPYGIAAGDFNGDGRPDLAATYFYRAQVSVFLNTTRCNSDTIRK